MAATELSDFAPGSCRVCWLTTAFAFDASFFAAFLGLESTLSFKTWKVLCFKASAASSCLTELVDEDDK
jgi:hypothetical protein